MQQPDVGKHPPFNLALAVQLCPLGHLVNDGPLDTVQSHQALEGARNLGVALAQYLCIALEWHNFWLYLLRVLWEKNNLSLLQEAGP